MSSPFRGRAIGWTIAAAVLFAPVPLLGQGPPAPDACDSAASAEPDDALAAARQLIARGESCDDQSAFAHALDRLGTELFRREAPAEAWYLAARARFALAQRGAIARTGPHLTLGMSYAQGAVAALREALRQDSTYAPAATLLANTELRRLARVDDDADAELIRRASGAGADADLLLSRMRREIDWRIPDSALALVDRAFASGADSALVELERARALLMLGRLADGAAAWLDGLASAMSDSARAAYQRDLAWVATDREMETFDSVMAEPPAARRAWGAEFWERRGAADFRSAAERLADHEERVRFALREFAVRDRNRDYNKAMGYHSDQHLIDDRGIVYIRHGPPTRIIRSGENAFLKCPVYSWLYDAGPDRGLVVHFRPYFSLMISPRRFCAYHDFKLVPGGVWVDRNVWQIAKYDSLYARWLGERRPTVRRRLGRQVVAEDLDRMVLAVTTDADPHRFARELHGVVRSYGLSDPSRILVAFSLPPDGLGLVGHGASEAIPLRLRVTALPREGSAVTLDTTILYDASRHLRPDQWLVGYVELPAPGAHYEVRTLMTGADPSAGSFHIQPAVEVPATMPGQPTVSALVLGTAASELRWPTLAGGFPLSPLDGYKVGSDVELFLEVHGLPAGAAADVELSLAPTTAPRREAVQLRSTEHAKGTTLTVRRSLSLAKVKPGLYILRAEVRLPDGQSISREQTLGVGN
ncbi:MAG TPA: GWxTD domain-containing protein [Gemmatimonadales bacterium]|nr:GWxTD domain-containing protein [Gemmatimonadales bacterium]